MTLIRRNPYSLFDIMQREFDKLSNRAMVEGDENGNVVTSDWAPAVDIKEEDTQYKIIADIPGVNPDDIEVKMEDAVLSIKGERQSESSENREGYKRVERVRGSFLRRFSMPDTVDADGITARSKDGVLEVVIPKQAKVLPKRIKVES